MPYYNISEAEMDVFLRSKGFEPIVLNGVYELVYAKRVHQDQKQLSLRVFTGIVAGKSRGVGNDAMRVILFMRDNDGKIVKLGGSKRVNRVESWKKNLGNRIDSWLEYMPTQACPKCGMPVIPKKGVNGSFIGCVTYPSCNYTTNI